MKSRRDSPDIHPTTRPAAPAKRALREKLVERAAPTQQAITTDTPIFSLAALWLKYLREAGRVKATTINELSACTPSWLSRIWVASGLGR